MNSISKTIEGNLEKNKRIKEVLKCMFSLPNLEWFDYFESFGYIDNKECMPVDTVYKLMEIYEKYGKKDIKTTTELINNILNNDWTNTEEFSRQMLLYNTAEAIDKYYIQLFKEQK